MPGVKEISVSVGPTLKVGETYLKASASVTVTVDAAGEGAEAAMKEARRLVKKAYRRVLLDEVRLSTRIQRQTSLERLVDMLLEEEHGVKDRPAPANPEASAGPRLRRRRA